MFVRLRFKFQPIYPTIIDKMNDYNPLPGIQEKEPEYSQTPKKPKSKKILVTILILVFVAAIGYIAYDKYNDYMNVRYNEVANYGQLYGQQQLLLQIVEVVANCQQFPITIPMEVDGQAVNQTINLIAVECLQGTVE